MMLLLAWVTLGGALISTACFLGNLLVFRRAPQPATGHALLPVSVLIPARDEALGIRETVEAVLASRGVDLEVVVLDDHSEDATASIVAELADRVPAIRLVRGRPLPGGWCGKQFACHQLAEQAQHDELLFLDADVKLAPDAIRRCLRQRQVVGADLLSGFPRQIVGTLGEAILLPLIHIVLLTYLPLPLMRRTNMPAASAGCGQLFLTCRRAYRESGGHAAIRSSLHDGVTLPRQYRRMGCTTDLFDASDIAECRMYRGFRQTVHGLMKNAHEGFASVRLIVPATLMMAVGYVAPTLLALEQLWQPDTPVTLAVALVAAAVSYVPRLVTAARFDRSWAAAALFPLSILLFVALQWVTLVRNLRGSRATWRGRTYAPSAT